MKPAEEEETLVEAEVVSDSLISMMEEGSTETIEEEKDRDSEEITGEQELHHLIEGGNIDSTMISTKIETKR